MREVARRKVALAVFATLLVLSALGLVGEVPAQLDVTITLRDILAFEPGTFTVDAEETVSLTLINAGALTHTFTLFAQADANVPVSDFGALLDYYNVNTKIVDLTLVGGQERSTNFTAPLAGGVYTFVCMIPGHAAGGMHGLMQLISPFPTIAITSPTDGSNLSVTSVTVTGVASDDVGVDKVELSTDEMAWVLATGTTSWSGTLALAEGPNTIFARATDTGNNTATASVAVTVDTRSPVVAITSPLDGASLPSPDVVVSGTASDDGAVEVVELSLDGTVNVLATGTNSWSASLILADGPNTIFARATDTSGNVATVSISVTVDPMNPTAHAGEDQTVNVGAQVSFDARGSLDNIGIVSYEWDFGDGATGTGETTAHTYSEPGTYTVTLTVHDAAGNDGTDSLIVSVQAPPSFQFSQTLIIFAGVGVAAAAGVAAMLLWRARKKGKTG